MSSDDENYLTSEEFESDKRAKTSLVTSFLKDKFASAAIEESSSSTIPLFREIHQAIEAKNDNSELKADVLTGGVTNYSYKVYVTNHPELCIFAKLSFAYAAWNPDRSAHFDLQRTSNEYEIMNTFSTHKPECVVAPLACYDIEHDGQKMKLLVTEFAKADEQFANQHIEGSVDIRLAPKLADMLATIHNMQGIDPSFNDQCKLNVSGLNELILKYVKETSCASTTPKDRTEKYMVETGGDVMIKAVQTMHYEYLNCRDCLQHGDCHVFNTLVESKPSIEKLEAFGPNGDFVQCDWEMSFVGPKGLDVGVCLSYPIMCMMVHAKNGHTDAVLSIKTYAATLLDCYEQRMVEAGKTYEEMFDIMRHAVGWCGCFFFQVFYYLRVFLDTLPVNSEDDREFIRDTMGALGLKMIRVCYDNDFCTEISRSVEVRRVFMSLLEEEVASIAQSRSPGLQPRRLSSLRASNRRVSDASLTLMAFTSRNLSLLSVEEDT